MAPRSGPVVCRLVVALLGVAAVGLADASGSAAAAPSLLRLGSAGRVAAPAQVAAAAAALARGRPLYPTHPGGWGAATASMRVSEESDDDDDDEGRHPGGGGDGDDKGGGDKGGGGKDGRRHGECKAKYKLDRGMFLAGEMVAPPEDTILLDASTTFLRRTRGFSAAQVDASRHEAFDHFRERFGVDMAGAKYNASAGIYTSRDGKFIAFAFAFAFPLAKVADSARLVGDCPDTLAMWGGWGAEGEGVTLRGTFGGRDGVKFSDEAMVTYSYLVFSPGSRASTVVKMAGRAPLVCTEAGTCALSDTMVLDDGFHEPLVGAAEGVLSFEPAREGEGRGRRGEGGERTVFRLGLTWPGRLLD